MYSKISVRGIIAVFETAILKHFELEGPDEGFGPGVLAGVGACGHALAQSGLAQALAEGCAAVLAAAATVKYGAVGGTCGEGVKERGENELRAHRFLATLHQPVLQSETGF